MPPADIRSELKTLTDEPGSPTASELAALRSFPCGGERVGERFGPGRLAFELEPGLTGGDREHIPCALDFVHAFEWDLAEDALDLLDRAHSRDCKIQRERTPIG